MIDGIHLKKEFITSDEEAYLISEVSRNKGITSGGGLYQSRYGSSVYSKKLVSDTIPEHLKILCDRLWLTHQLPHSPKHVTVNTYTAGSVIKPHIDKISCGKVITILSLASDATMMLTKDDLREELLLPRRSLLQLTGDARYNWFHEILPVNQLRYSIVFRD